MSMRISSLLGLSLLLAACGKVDPKPTESPLAGASASLSRSGSIACGRDGDTVLQADCKVERTPTQDGLILTVRHPDGGFRRLRVTKDGRGVIAADGAQAAKVTIVGPHEIEVALGGDRYRLPATVAGQPAP